MTRRTENNTPGKNRKHANRDDPSPDGVSAVLPQEGFVRQPVVLAVFGTTRATLWRWVATGRFPRPYKLSPGTTAWNVADLREHMKKICEGRSGDSR